MRFTQLIRGTASMAVLAAFVTAAHAQTTPVPPQAQIEPDVEQDAAPNTVQEIIVTAQKREQSLQDVPIVVTTLSEQILEDTGVRDIKDLQILTPGLLVTSTTNETVTTARIRGVGTVGDNPGLESSVGVVIDGVYRPRNGVGFGDLGELERVEVLKGPQGTLFGKNTSAGVINIITADPSFDFGGEGELTIGNYDNFGIAASVTGPLAEKAAGRLYVAKRERGGFYDIRTGEGPRTNTEDQDQNFYTIRGQLLITPTANTELEFSADFTERRENCCSGATLIRGPLAGAVDAVAAQDSGVLNPVDPFSRIAYANRDTTQNIDDSGLSMEFNGEFGDMTFTSITAARKWETLNGQDSDFSTADLLYRPANGSFRTGFDQFSQEFRLAGESGRLNWLVGAFLSNEELENRNGLFYGDDLFTFLSLGFSQGASPVFLRALTAQPTAPLFVAGQGQDDSFQQTSDSIAVFTNNSFAVTDQLELTLGLRYTKESKELASQYRNTHNGLACAASAARQAQITAALGAFAPLYFGYVCAAFNDPSFANLDTRQEREDDALSGTAKLAYRLNDNLMTYGSYARGYKAGGYNLDRARTNIGQPDPNTSFAEETVDSWELGTKTTWLDDTLLLNGTLFHQTYENFQLNTFTGIAFVVVSVPEVVSRGVDADFVWFTPVDGLTMQGGVTYAETQYGNARPNLPLFDFPGTPGNTAGGSSYRLPGSRVSFAPLWSSSVSATYERPIGTTLMARANMGVKYTSSYNTGSDLNPQKVQGAMALVNARIGVGAADERWALEAFAQNLTDEEYYQVAFDPTFQFQSVNAFLGQPRTYGLTLRVKY